MKTITDIMIVFLLFLFPLNLKSAHIVGGNTAYQILSLGGESATASVTFYLYKDGNSNTPFDQNAEIGLYGYIGEGYQYIAKKNIVLSQSIPLEFENIDNCAEDFINYSMGIYTFQIDIPLNGFEHYTIALQRCCRGDDLSNILNPEETGIAITLEIFPKAFEYLEEIVPLNNAFPIFSKPGEVSTFDLSIEDNFHKEYYLSAPKTAGGVLGSEPGDPFDCNGITPNPEKCLPEYSDVEYLDPENPYGPGAYIEMDTLDGIMKVDIPLVSKVLLGITLDRYFENQLVCRVRQQFIINTFNCDLSSTEDIESAKIDIWPNPIEEIIYFNQALKNISIYNFNGSLISKVANDELLNQVKSDHLHKGMYFLRGQTVAGQWITKKMVKCH